MINSGRIQKENFHYFTKAASQLTDEDLYAFTNIFST